MTVDYERGASEDRLDEVCVSHGASIKIIHHPNHHPLQKTKTETFLQEPFMKSSLIRTRKQPSNVL